jgi:serine/threonine protein kinase
LNQSEEKSDSLAKQFRKEATIMYTIRSQWIVPLLGACFEQNHHCLIMPYYKNGSLYNFLHKNDDTNKRDLDWATRYRLLIECVRSLNSLHKNQTPILHRDLKTKNFLLTDDLHIVVSDFGLSRFQGFSFIVCFTIFFLVF